MTTNTQAVKLNKILTLQWIANLLSGAFLQGKQYLYAKRANEVQYCCLGVAVTTLPLGGEWTQTLQGGGSWMVGTNSCDGLVSRTGLLSSQLEKLGLSNQRQLELQARNDGAWDATGLIRYDPHTFHQIAALLKKWLIDDHGYDLTEEFGDSLPLGTYVAVTEAFNEEEQRITGIIGTFHDAEHPHRAEARALLAAASVDAPACTAVYVYTEVTLEGKRSLGGLPTLERRRVFAPIER